MPRICVFVLLAFLAYPSPPARAEGAAPDLKSAIARAERVVVAAVTGVQPLWQENEWGDQLIVSRARVRPTETLKGAPSSDDFAVDMVGGTLGGLTLRVSHAPLVAAGDRVIFLLKRGHAGVLVPTDHGAGVWKLTADDTVAGTHVRLEDVRRAARATR